MKNYDYWKSFIDSGKIDDYLHYIACTREEGTEDIQPASYYSAKNRDNSMRSIDREREGGFIAGIDYSNGDGSIGHAGW